MSVPGPDLLVDSPEFAALAILDTALRVSTHALIAANTELMSDDFIRDLVAAPAVQACLAQALIEHIAGLQRALGRYRDCLAHSRSRHHVLDSDF